MYHPFWQKEGEAVYKILIIEDDLIISKTLTENLKKWNYQAEYVTDFQKVLEQFIHYNPQLVLMDISLPYFNGYHWCTKIRNVSKVPIIFLSSASDNMNIIMAMNMGGDDFIAKPFDFMVLIAKIQALIRRTYSFQGQLNILEQKGVILNLSDATLSYQDEKISLTKNEYKILQILMENAGKTVSRDIIMTRLWENDSFIDDNTLTVNMNRLRKKLETSGLENFIITKKGIGYLVEAE